MRSPMPAPSRHPSARRSSRRRSLAAGAMLAVLALAGPLAACAPGGEPQPLGESPSSSDSSTAGLEEFHDQELLWEACDDYATTSIEQEVYAVVEGTECARMAVPLDYEDPNGAAASVAVLRVPARGESQGPLVINPGGPGGSGLMGAVNTAAGMAESPVTARATERFQEIMQPLREDPVPALGVELTFDGAVGGMISGLYSPQNWEDIITGIREVEQGRGDTLLQLSYAFSLRDPDGGWPNQNEANHAINCMDEERLSPEEGAQLRQQTYEQAPFMDPGVDVSDGAHEGCEHWPAEPTLGFPHAQDIEGLPETLVVALTQDPTTPYEGSEAMAASLGSSLLTVQGQGQGHTIVAAGLNDCVNQVAADYLIDLKTPEDGASCTL